MNNPLLFARGGCFQAANDDAPVSQEFNDEKVQVNSGETYIKVCKPNEEMNDHLGESYAKAKLREEYFAIPSLHATHSYSGNLYCSVLPKPPPKNL